MKQVGEKLNSEKSAKERTGNYIKHKNGAVFLVAENTKSVTSVFLISRKNKSHSFQVQKLKQGMIDGEWLEVNEHEVKDWDSDYTDYMLKLTQKVLRHVIMAELLISVDEDLDADQIGDRYFRNLLQKSNKQAMRIADRHLDNLFKADPVMIQNMLRIIEDFTSKLASLSLDDYPFFAKYADKYFEDPKKYRDLKVEFQKPNE